MCCKCCQNYLETIYWHCFEKHFCYDKSIAEYDVEENASPEKEPAKQRTQEEKNNQMFDNMAYYDNVAIIANRAIFCIEPPKAQEEIPVVTQQPAKRQKWWQNSPTSTPSPERPNKPIFIIHECDTSSSSANSTDSLATIREENLNTASLNIDNTLCVPVKMRKKSLHERRVSKSLTLNIDKIDMPIIRQSSFPKFYLDTPELNQVHDSSIIRSPIQALETPIQPNSEFKFDLRSVVQLEKERSMTQLAHTSSQKDNRFIHIKDKLKPLKILRNASSASLQSYMYRRNSHQ
ncbi:PREDICTED: uncharacterized protein LOC108569348 [Nicrophorus vespilloides]|uniref:Uncharacterized protein LOC108569348 n=1 Tax=Nicrophorus vespilloides TaxID=110193 RepID=A0ABM1NHQ6_NICVS|nr:PREDICTED: uncharacterized protein LOC108569348 [Nicrophorus vespilloides]